MSPILSTLKIHRILCENMSIKKLQNKLGWFLHDWIGQQPYKIKIII